METFVQSVEVGTHRFVFRPLGHPVLILTRHGFFYNGELVPDVGRSYDLFMDVMTRINAQHQREALGMVAELQRYHFLRDRCRRGPSGEWIFTLDEALPADSHNGAELEEEIDDAIDNLP